MRTMKMLWKMGMRWSTCRIQMKMKVLTIMRVSLTKTRMQMGSKMVKMKRRAKWLII